MVARWEDAGAFSCCVSIEKRCKGAFAGCRFGVLLFLSALVCLLVRAIFALCVVIFLPFALQIGALPCAYLSTPDEITILVCRTGQNVDRLALLRRPRPSLTEIHH